MRQLVHSEMWLRNASVFIDFDGTITTQDVTTHLLQRISRHEWVTPGLRFRRGELSARECLQQEWAMLPHDLAILLAVAAEVPIDEGFEPLLAMLLACNAEVTVISDGFGFYIERVIKGRVQVVSNRVNGEVLEFPHLSRNTGCNCDGCGVCKPSHVRAAIRRGRTAIVIGDGTSDREAARVANMVFAKRELAKWCCDEQVPHIPIVSLGDVISSLKGPGFVT